MLRTNLLIQSQLINWLMGDVVTKLNKSNGENERIGRRYGNGWEWDFETFCIVFIDNYN